MKKVAVFFVLLSLCCCNSLSEKKEHVLSSKDLTAVVDSISVLMSKYHYNPQVLTTEKYLALQENIKDLARKAQTKQEFIEKHNEIWSDGPFSHVKLGVLKQKAEDIADLIDTMLVGGKNVSLEFIEDTAVLTVTTMMGIDTKELIYGAYLAVAKQKPSTLIIDLRNNSGGTFAGIPLVGHILSDSLEAGMFISRKWWEKNNEIPDFDEIQNLTPWQGWSLKSFWENLQSNPITPVVYEPMVPQFGGRVYVLINNKTASAAELAADAFGNQENVTLIGETTAGEMLSQKMFDLPHGLQLSLPIADFYSTRIGRIEGNGIIPDIVVDQSVALDLALLIISGEDVSEALKKVQQNIDSQDIQPFEGETIYLFGNMNDWGQKWASTPSFEYKGKGKFQTKTTLPKGRYEFKIAPMNWNFDFGAKSGKKNMILNQENPVTKIQGNGNLIISIHEETNLEFTLDVNNENALKLHISSY